MVDKNLKNHHQAARLLTRLEQAGKRSTPQRHAVCQVLAEYDGHPTVAEVFERVRQIFPMISQATVYNTIDTLEELGLIRRLNIANDDHAHYDLDLEPHINVVCQQCGNIRDLYLDEFNYLLQAVQQQTGYTINPDMGVVLYGRCPACQAHSDHSRHAELSETFIS